VGDGAKRVTTVSVISAAIRGRAILPRDRVAQLTGKVSWHFIVGSGGRIWHIGRAAPGPRRGQAKGLGRMTATETAGRDAGQDFIRDIVRADLDAGRHSTVITRFPPEPNGYLHIGHAKSIGLNFGIAEEFGGRCHLRFDDTNPTKEEQEYIDAIERDVRWLGYDWGKHLYHASDYFDQLYEWAEHLVRTGKAFIDDQSQDDIRRTRGTLTEPGQNSPWRERPVEENLDLFRRMRTGEFPNGARVLRAKIDMASGNINLRDPVLYRILHANHPRTGGKWCIYPSYDFAHGQSDAIEGVTHSICTLEFEDHRPLYDWLIENLPVPSRPRQYEFARLNLTYTVLSKRVLTELVRGGHVKGWDDPRMPTLAGLRRRGVPPVAIRDFVGRIGVAKANSVVDAGLLDFSIREVLNRSALRRMAVLRPLKVVIENYPDGPGEELAAANHPDDAAAGTRAVRFGREIFVERDDFMENPPKKFFRLSPGKEVRLRYAYFVTCREVVKDAAGEAVELRCTYDPATRGGNAPDGRKVQATLHWVSGADSVPAEVRLYNPLFAQPDPNVGNFAADLSPNSLDVLTGCRLEPALAATAAGEAVQFERQGYFCLDPDSAPERLVFNRTVGLRDTWAKVSGAKAA
jgi:glutaminyl-tRNA synthetase